MNNVKVTVELILILCLNFGIFSNEKRFQLENV